MLPTSITPAAGSIRMKLATPVALPVAPSTMACTSGSSPRHVARIQPLSRSEEHTSELQSLMRISYAVFCLKKKNNQQPNKRLLHLHTNQNAQTKHTHSDDS